MKITTEKQYKLQTTPIIGAMGGASMGSLFGSTGTLIGGFVGVLLVFIIILYFDK